MPSSLTRNFLAEENCFRASLAPRVHDDFGAGVQAIDVSHDNTHHSNFVLQEKCQVDVFCGVSNFIPENCQKLVVNV